MSNTRSLITPESIVGPGSVQTPLKIVKMCAPDDSPNRIPPAEVTEHLVEQLQQAFIKPWLDVCPTAPTDEQTDSHLLKDVPPPLPSVGQVKSTLKHLNPKKATGVDGIPAWLLKRFNEELALVVHNIICASIVQCKYPKPYKEGIPQYLADELENIQAKNLNIIGIPKDSLLILHERRDKQTMKEYERIINDISNSCNNLIPSPVRHPYDLRCQTTTDGAPIRSYTDRHKKSFIPRAVSLLH